ncbi:MAG: phosphoribosylformylglycinamidine synthase I [Candidatus Latescibacteria bacterium]|nr:phosphoribosylformylglycinamidine synthase I [Candidatus Latescibacterota bacterium]
MPSEVKVVVLRAAGTNCDYETCYAFYRAGAVVELVHINQLVRGEKKLSPYQILAIPGGFTYGDDIEAGKILANELKYKLKDQIEDFIQQGKLVIGICNGFQVLVKAGLLPATSGPAALQEATLSGNDSGKFEDRWVYLKPFNADKCVFTRGIKETLYLPVAHAEGKFIPRDPAVLQKLRENRQVIFRYVGPDGNPGGYPWNPNGSVDDIAAICDPTGRVLGLMPHPERHIDPVQHPRWTREGLNNRGDGMLLFDNAIKYIKEGYTTAASSEKSNK